MCTLQVIKSNVFLYCIQSVYVLMIICIQCGFSLTTFHAGFRMCSFCHKSVMLRLARARLESDKEKCPAAENLSWSSWICQKNFI